MIVFLTTPNKTVHRLTLCPSWSFLVISIIAYISWSWAISDHLVKLVLLLGARTTSTNRHSSFIVWGIWGAPNFGPGHTHLWVNTVRPNSGEICQTCPFPLVVRNTLMLITTGGVSWNRRHPNQSLSLQKHQKNSVLVYVWIITWDLPCKKNMAYGWFWPHAYPLVN